MVQFNYKPDGSTLKSFLKEDDFFRGIRGPVGSGKSVACCVEIFKRAIQQQKGQDGKRKSRWAVIRNTNPQLKTTTIKTWLDWFPENTFGSFAWSVPYTHRIQVADIDLEVIFLALDRPEDVKKLLSLELTGVWVNEARELPKSIIDACTMRVGRFPSMRDGGPSWFGVIMDTNAPDETHWWGIMAGEVPAPEYMQSEEKMLLVKPDDWMFFSQQGAMREKKDENGGLLGYEKNPKAENTANIQPDYYEKIILGKTPQWVKVYVLNEYQALMDGKPVYQTFRKESHVATSPIEPIDGIEVIVGIDFGRTPSAVFTQQLHSGRWAVFHEVIGQDMGAGRFAEVLKREISRNDWDKHTFKFVGDPAGNQMAQTSEQTPFMILRAAGINAQPAPSNDAIMRVEAVEGVLNRMSDGYPAMKISPSCVVLISGFEGGYQYKRTYNMGQERYDERPSKNRFSHIHDALQYAFLGGGEGRRVVFGMAKSASHTTVERVGSPLTRQRKARLARGRRVAGL